MSITIWIIFLTILTTVLCVLAILSFIYAVSHKEPGALIITAVLSIILSASGKALVANIDKDTNLKPNTVEIKELTPETLYWLEEANIRVGNEELLQECRPEELQLYISKYGGFWEGDLWMDRRKVYKLHTKNRPEPVKIELREPKIQKK